MLAPLEELCGSMLCAHEQLHSTLTLIGRAGFRIGDLGTESGRSVAQEAQQKKGEDRRQVQSKNRRNDSTEQVQIRIRNGVYGLEKSDSLGLREPRQQDSTGDDDVVDAQKIREASNKHLLRNSVPRDCHCCTSAGTSFPRERTKFSTGSGLTFGGPV